MEIMYSDCLENFIENSVIIFLYVLRKFVVLVISIFHFQISFKLEIIRFISFQDFIECPIIIFLRLSRQFLVLVISTYIFKFVWNFINTIVIVEFHNSDNDEISWCLDNIHNIFVKVVSYYKSCYFKYDESIFKMNKRPCICLINNTKKKHCVGIKTEPFYVRARSPVLFMRLFRARIIDRAWSA